MAKVRAVIEADSGTLLVDFPQGIYALYEKLRSVGIRHSPSNIPIADEEDGAIRVKLYAEDDVGKRLTLLFSEDNTLAEVNTTAFVMENTDPEIRPQLEENLLHGQYASFQELIDDVREMTYALGSVRRSYFCPLRGSVDDGEYEDLWMRTTGSCVTMPGRSRRSWKKTRQPRRPPWRNFFMMTPASRQSWFPLFGMWRDTGGSCTERSSAGLRSS